MENDLSQAIREAVLRGHKIEAIRLYRAQHGVGLAEAKAAIDDFEQTLRTTPGGSSPPPLPPAAPPPLPGSAPADIQAALFAGKKIEAIRLYREQHGVGLAEAKAAIDDLEAKLRAGPGSSLSTNFEPGGSPPFDSAQTAIQAALYAGRKIEAIRLYRQAHHLGLAEAKSVIDEMEADLRRRSPWLFTSPAATPKAGCLVLVLTLIGLACGVWRLMH